MFENFANPLFSVKVVLCALQSYILRLDSQIDDLISIDETVDLSDEIEYRKEAIDLESYFESLHKELQNEKD